MVGTVRLRRLINMRGPRVALAAALAAIAVTGGIAAHLGSGSCRGSGCGGIRVVRWSRPLTGAWVAQSSYGGTVFASADAHAAAGYGTAVIGYGLTLSAYEVSTGFPRWSQTLSGFPPGSAILAVHAWRGVITVGIGLGPPGSAAERAARPAVPAGRLELVLDATTGKKIRSYRAATTGGAVFASKRRTVIVARTAVTGYSNATGRPVWRDPAGAPGQSWRVSGDQVYITISAQGAAGTAPVTGVRAIDLANGAQRLITTPGGWFDGMLAAVVGGSLVFSGGSGLSLYAAATGRLTGFRANAVADGTDPVLGVLYAEVGGALTALNPVTGQDEPGAAALPTGAYAVRDGLAIGLGQGSGASVWVYSVGRRRVLWTAKPLPWPHYFAESSGLPGSADPASQMVLITTCAAIGPPVAGTVVSGDGRVCMRPRLVALGPWGPRA
jgi:hypothetical protein